MGKPPAFLLYAADFYMDTNTWTIDEIGVYTRLLMSEWVNGPLPNEESRLARAAGCTLHRFKNSWGQVKIKFKENEEGFLFNARLEEVREKQKEYEERQRVKGKKSAEKRWGERVTTVNHRLQPTHKPEGNSSSSISIEEEINKGKKNLFIKPALGDVTAYCTERKNRVNPKAFMDHYESNGWKVGKNPMKDWKAAVRTWEHNNGTGRTGYSGSPGAAAEKTGGARSDGADYPTDHEFS